jgi:hypothetical protein
VSDLRREAVRMRLHIYDPRSTRGKYSRSNAIASASLLLQL